MKLTNRMSFLQYLLFVAHNFLGWGFDGVCEAPNARHDTLKCDKHRWIGSVLSSHLVYAITVCKGTQQELNSWKVLSKQIPIEIQKKWNEYPLPRHICDINDECQQIKFRAFGIFPIAVFALLSKSSIEHFNGLKWMLINKRHVNILLILLEYLWQASYWATTFHRSIPCRYSNYYYLVTLCSSIALFFFSFTLCAHSLYFVCEISFADPTSRMCYIHSSDVYEMI